MARTWGWGVSSAVAALALVGGVGCAERAAERSSARAAEPRTMRERVVSLLSHGDVWQEMLVADLPRCKVIEGEAAEAEHEFDGCQLVDDERNGWLQIVYRGVTMTFVEWTTASGDHLLGRDVDTGESFEWPTFWSYAGGSWRHRDDVLPRIDLRDFWDETSAPPDPRFTRVALGYDLPRRGTTIRARLTGPWDVDWAHGLSGLERSSDLEAQVAAVRAAKYRGLELVWDGRAGRFSKGRRSR